MKMVNLEVIGPDSSWTWGWPNQQARVGLANLNLAQLAVGLVGQSLSPKQIFNIESLSSIG